MKMMLDSLYTNCRLCPRNCSAKRANNRFGVCGMPSDLYLARAGLHFWEEPCISGEKGSGAVFFSGCSLKCVYCQNRSIALGKVAKKIEPERLCQIFFELKEQGANNINLVTASHYIPHVVSSITKAKNQGFDLPFIYNSSGYETVDSLKRIEGLIDIYLPDYKYALSADALKYSSCPDYPRVALSAIDEMVRQQPRCIFNKGLMESGVIVRHMLLPGKVIASKIAIKKLYERYSDSVYFSLMSQYTPLSHLTDYPELNRRVTTSEYKSLVDYAVELGVENAYVQSGEAAEERFIPEFDYFGL